MKEKERFDPARFFRLIRNEMRLSSGAVWAILGILLFVLVLLVLIGDFREDELPFHKLMYSNLLFFGLLVAGAAFKELHRPEESYTWLALPASLLEKYVSRLVLTSLGYFLVVTAAYTLFAMAFNGAIQMIHYQTGMPFNPFDGFVVKCLAIFLVGHSLVLVGAVYFRQMAYTLVLLAICSFIILGLVSTSIDGSTAAQLAIIEVIDRVPYLVTIMPANWVLGYYLLEKVEV